MNLTRYIIGVNKKQLNPSGKEFNMKTILKIALVCALAASSVFASGRDRFKIPAYHYNGADVIEGAVSDYVLSEFAPEDDIADVSIPVVNVIAVDYSNEDETLVWGSFWVYNYDLEGDTLVCTSGGEYPGLFRLERTEDGYEVKSFEMVADDSKYTKSAKKIFGKFYGAFKMVEADTELREKIRARTIAKYVKAHDLAVTKYKDSGWEARSI